jgi:hypothetical protein
MSAYRGVIPYGSAAQLGREEEGAWAIGIILKRTGKTTGRNRPASIYFRETRIACLALAQANLKTSGAGERAWDAARHFSVLAFLLAAGFFGCWMLESMMMSGGPSANLSRQFPDRLLM